jgi:hypothetical protein
MYNQTRSNSPGAEHLLNVVKQHLTFKAPPKDGWTYDPLPEELRADTLASRNRCVVSFSSSSLSYAAPNCRPPVNQGRMH